MTVTLGDVDLVPSHVVHRSLCPSAHDACHVELSPVRFGAFHNWLVVDLPLWKIWKSMGLGLSHIWNGKEKSCSKPPTRYMLGTPKTLDGFLCGKSTSIWGWFTSLKSCGSSDDTPMKHGESWQNWTMKHWGNSSMDPCLNRGYQNGRFEGNSLLDVKQNTTI